MHSRMIVYKCAIHIKGGNYMLSNTQLSQMIYNGIDKSVVLEEIKKGRDYHKMIQTQKRFSK